MANWSQSPLTSNIQKILSPLLAEFKHNDSLSKSKNLDVLLSRIKNDTDRSEVDAAVGMKKNSFYEKVIAAHQKDQETTSHFDSFAEPAPKEQDRMEVDDFSNFAEPVGREVTESLFEREMREADEILAAIKAARVAGKK